MPNKKTIIVLAFTALLELSAWGTPRIVAQSPAAPQIILTWQASTYVPPEYEGKALPTAYSFINAALEVIQSGKPANLSNQTIYWYLNDDLLPLGSGKQAVGFLAPAAAPTALSLRAELPSFGGGLITKTVSIPVVPPQAVIEAPFPNGNFGNASIKLEAAPYFFNVKDPSALNYNWSVNGAPPQNATNPRELVINVNPNAAPGSTLAVGLTIQNPASADESAAQAVTLTFSL